jgi:hypothetical protein
MGSCLPYYILTILLLSKESDAQQDLLYSGLIDSYFSILRQKLFNKKNPIVYMIPENEISYPDVKQSWGIAGISILAMLILSPITIVLDRLIDKEFAVLVYYLLAMGITFWFAHTNRKKNMQIATYDFDPASLKITVFASVAVIAIQIGVVSPIVNAIPIPEFMEQIFIEFGKRKGIFSAIAIVLAAPILEELVLEELYSMDFLKSIHR